jgi:hypothetical protein
VHALITQLAVAQAGHGIILVQALLGLGGGLDVPFEQVGIQRPGHFVSKHGLAGAGLALDQQGPLQNDGCVNGNAQVFSGDIVGRAFKLHGCMALSGRFQFSTQRAVLPKPQSNGNAPAVIWHRLRKRPS